MEKLGAEEVPDTVVVPRSLERTAFQVFSPGARYEPGSAEFNSMSSTCTRGCATRNAASRSGRFSNSVFSLLSRPVIVQVLKFLCISSFA